MPKLDLLFPLRGLTLPLDSAYKMYAAICRVLPSLHETTDVGIFPVKGLRAGPGVLAIAEHSTLRLRLPQDRIAEVLPLAGKMLDLDGHRIAVGVPHIAALTPASTLICRLAVIKPARADGVPAAPPTPETFLTAAKKQLAALNIQADLAIPTHPSHPASAHAGQPRRKVVRIKSATIVGYPLLATGLTAADSITLQEAGLGGRRLLGCGLFVEAR